MIVIGAIIARLSHELLRNLAHSRNKPDIPKNLIALMEEMRKLSKDCYASIYPHISSFKKEARLPSSLPPYSITPLKLPSKKMATTLLQKDVIQVKRNR